MKSFYEARAFEKNATCTRPRMTPVGTTVVEETAERVVMNVRYHFRDENIDFDDDDDFPPFGGGGVLGRCDDWAERTFTLVKRTDGGVDVVAMTGPQRFDWGRIPRWRRAPHLSSTTPIRDRVAS